MSRALALADVLLALALTLAAGLGAALIGRALGGGQPLMLVLAGQGLIILAGLWLLLRARGRHWAELRLPAPRPLDLVRGLGALLMVFAASALFSLLLTALLPAELEGHQRRLTELAGVLTGDRSVAAVAAVMLFVGFYEELLARGFLLSRCESLLGSGAAAVLVSALLFGLGHAYQGWTGVVQTTLVGVVFAALTLRWGTLWPAIFAHAALNTLSLVVLRASVQ